MLPLDSCAAGVATPMYRRVRSSAIGVSMMDRISVAALLALTIGLSAPALAGDSDAGKADGSAERSARMFERMKTLVGEWQGTYEWTGGRTGSGELRVTYALTGAGSVLMEHLHQGGDVPSMSSLYHLDGADLRMTHFCGARNQPRLKADTIGAGAEQADFSFVDVTGLTKNGYVQAATLRILDADHVDITFKFGGGPPNLSGTELIKLERVRTAAAGR
jgi:hypothetical protein